MASALLKGKCKIVAEDVKGTQIKCYEFDMNSAIAAGGSPDGVLANLTIDKQVKIQQAGPIMTGGHKLRLFIKLSTTDGADASDAVVQFPITSQDDGSVIHLTAADFGYTVDLPAAVPVDYWVELGTGYSIPEGSNWRAGGSNAVLSLQDDTA